MIFDLVESAITGNKIAIPVNNPGQYDAWEMAEMIAKAFPYHPEIQFNFYVCCAGGYDNGIEFGPTHY